MNIPYYSHWFRMAILPIAFFGMVNFSFSQDSQKQTPAATGLDEYKLVWERNIFNPDRRRPLSPSEIVQPQPAPKIDQFNLMGTLVAEASAFAFFDGSESAFRSVFKIGDQIAGYTIAEIRSDGVTMKKNDQPVEILVGKGMERQDQGEWKSVEGARVARSGSRRSSSQNASPAQRNRERPSASQTPTIEKTESAQSTNEESGSSVQNDIRKKMMEKRKQEMQK